MPWTNNPVIDSLRLRYNAALAAHSASKRALIDAMIAGPSPAAELVEAEAKAKALLENVRAKLLAEMTKAINSGAEPKPPTQT